jgi:hypothetical protein
VVPLVLHYTVLVTSLTFLSRGSQSRLSVTTWALYNTLVRPAGVARKITTDHAWLLFTAVISDLLLHQPVCQCITYVATLSAGPNMIGHQSIQAATSSKVEEKYLTTLKLRNDSLFFWPIRICAVVADGGPSPADSRIHDTTKAVKTTLDHETVPAAALTKRKHDDEETAISYSVRFHLLPHYTLVGQCTESVSEESAERPPKRVKLGEDKSSSPSTSANTLIFASAAASASLRCPMAVADPERHSACSPMSSNGAVARHLFQHHRRAPYCPTCWTTFTSDTERDGHIRLRECKHAESRHIEGLSVKQLAQLVPCFDLEDACERTWLRMLRLVARN